MSLLVVLLAVGLLAAPVAVATSDLNPSAKTRIGCASIVSGLGMAAIGLTLSASPLLLSWRHETNGHWDAAGHVAPGGQWVWGVAAVALAIGLAIAVNAVARTRRMRRQAGFPRWAATATRFEHGIELRIAPSAAPVTYAVPGRDRHIVMSQGVRDGLSASELNAIVAHEAAHLVLSHQRYLFILTLYEQVCGWVPGTRPMIESLRLAIEQWADTVAVAAFGADPHAIPRAFRLFSPTSQSDQHIGARIPVVSRHWTSRPGELVAIFTLVLALAGGALYGAIHSVGDLATVVAAH